MYVMIIFVVDVLSTEFEFYLRFSSDFDAVSSGDVELALETLRLAVSSLLSWI